MGKVHSTKVSKGEVWESSDKRAMEQRVLRPWILFYFFNPHPRMCLLILERGEGRERERERNINERERNIDWLPPMP